MIAFAGSDKKVSWLKELGADHVFNYKTTTVHDALSKAAPKGVNIYFDNVSLAACWPKVDVAELCWECCRYIMSYV